VFTCLNTPPQLSTVRVGEKVVLCLKRNTNVVFQNSCYEWGAYMNSEHNDLMKHEFSHFFAAFVLKVTTQSLRIMSRYENILQTSFKINVYS
jgi:hypothetical protein